jgi:hypothetical protein
MEKHYNGHDMLPGQGKFVAAFASTNLGDVSPNTKGPKCIDTGKPKSFYLLQNYVKQFAAPSHVNEWNLSMAFLVRFAV